MALGRFLSEQNHSVLYSKALLSSNELEGDKTGASVQELEPCRHFGCPQLPVGLGRQICIRTPRGRVINSLLQLKSTPAHHSGTPTTATRSSH